jgi:hypothetical protein
MIRGGGHLIAIQYIDISTIDDVLGVKRVVSTNYIIIKERNATRGGNATDELALHGQCSARTACTFTSLSFFH